MKKFILIASLLSAVMAHAVDHSDTKICGTIVENDNSQVLYIKNNEYQLRLATTNMAMSDKEVNQAESVMNSLTIGESVCLVGWVTPMGQSLVPFSVSK